jgi:hypothetical protein
VLKQSTVLLSFAVICNVSHTFAQSPRFGGQPITKAVQAEWRRFSDADMKLPASSRPSASEDRLYRRRETRAFLLPMHRSQPNAHPVEIK